MGLAITHPRHVKTSVENKLLCILNWPFSLIVLKSILDKQIEEWLKMEQLRIHTGAFDNTMKSIHTPKRQNCSQLRKYKLVKRKFESVNLI
jgi:hypothetical protein